VGFNKDSKIFVAGHNGMVGSAILRLLKGNGYNNLIYKSRKELNLLDQYAVKNYYKSEKPEYVFICAAKVGGIYANNTYRAQFIYENLQIQNNLIHFAHENSVTKLLFLGSSCIYPRECPQPIKEQYLLTNPLEKTNEPYAIAKIAGIKMCESYHHQYGSQFFSIMPTNIYGPNDNYNLETSHVLPALLRKVHEAKLNHHDNTTIWGTGKPQREFMHVDDLARAAIFVINYDINRLYDEGFSYLNVGSGEEISIRNLALLISKKLDYSGKIKFDPQKPDGTLRKVMDSSIIHNLGCMPLISLDEGIETTYEDFLLNYEIYTR